MNWLDSIRTRSISVLAVQAGGCRGCAMDFHIALSQEDAIKGITVTGNPKHADALLITGCINEKARDRLLELYDQIPLPKAVIAAGACTCSGGLFHREGSGLFPLEEILPVDAWIRGCSPGPNDMLEAVVRAIECISDREESREEI